MVCEQTAEQRPWCWVQGLWHGSCEFSHELANVVFRSTCHVQHLLGQATTNGEDRRDWTANFRYSITHLRKNYFLSVLPLKYKNSYFFLSISSVDSTPNITIIIITTISIITTIIVVLVTQTTNYKSTAGIHNPVLPSLLPHNPQLLLHLATDDHPHFLTIGYC